MSKIRPTIGNIPTAIYLSLEIKVKSLEKTYQIQKKQLSCLHQKTVYQLPRTAHIAM